ncbi:MAG TPA: cytochrome c oxidase assembly protein [Thermomicrobiales bacterium]|nr:cytochrome c oxidase assembly protein [Thermomicrobiales bacterium]
MEQHAQEVHTNALEHSGGWLIMLLLLIPLLLYLGAVMKEHRRQRPWSKLRSLSYISAIALIAVAVSPMVTSATHHDPRGHMAQHLLLGMFAPLGLVLAAPITLLFRTLPLQAGRSLARFLRSRTGHLLSHPFMALVLNIGGMYVLYLTPLFRLSLSHPALHILVSVHFLAFGYLYIWAIAGPDPAPRRPGMRVRTAVLGTGIAAHAFLAKLMYAHALPAGTPFSTAEVRDAAMLMYYGGDVAEFLLAVALFASWYRGRRRSRARRRARPVLVISTIRL